MAMEMEQWIEQRINKLKKQIEKYPDDTRIPEYTLEWIAEMFQSAWQHGNIQGSDEAFEKMREWRREQNQ